MTITVSFLLLILLIFRVSLTTFTRPSERREEEVKRVRVESRDPWKGTDTHHFPTVCFLVSCPFPPPFALLTSGPSVSLSVHHLRARRSRGSLDCKERSVASDKTGPGEERERDRTTLWTEFTRLWSLSLRFASLAHSFSFHNLCRFNLCFPHFVPIIRGETDVRKVEPRIRERGGKVNG